MDFLECNETELKKQREAALLLYNYALEKETGIKGVPYVKDERGKPYIPNSKLHISISHCRKGIACIISDSPVGIDVEEASRMNLKIAKRICTPDELLLLENAENKQEYLCRLWVLKEAYSKMTGQGMAVGFSSVNTTKSGFYAKKRNGEPSLFVGIVSEKAINTEPEEITFSAYP